VKECRNWVVDSAKGNVHVLSSLRKTWKGCVEDDMCIKVLKNALNHEVWRCGIYENCLRANQAFKMVTMKIIAQLW